MIIKVADIEKYGLPLLWFTYYEVILMLLEKICIPVIKLQQISHPENFFNMPEYRYPGYLSNQHKRTLLFYRLIFTIGISNSPYITACR